MYKESEIIAMQQEAAALKLKFPAEFLQLPPSELARIANGYGPERWPESMRKILNWIFRYYPTPAAIHDLRYEFSDGREPTRRAADAEFAANLRIVWKNKYAFGCWINPLAWYAAIKLHTAVALTREFGRRAWLDSWRRHRKEAGEI
ncbi:MAG: hypothetical protein E7052_10840 [Lentisphaerae bacterium]|nr:hypothetical protein [Lentisphaerota bacterium]